MERKEQRVCIVIPPSPHLCDERVFPQLGPLRVAGALIQSGVSVDVVDCSGYTNYSSIVEKYALESDTNIFAIGCTTPQLPNAEVIIRAIRQAKPRAKVILGGVHVTTACSSYKREKKLGIVSRGTKAFSYLFSLADVLVSGDGERAALVAIKTDSPPLVDADDPNSPLFLQADDIADYPFPRRDLIELNSYKYTIDGIKSTSIVGQLGCPMQCTFCGARLSSSFRKMRVRPITNLIEEIEHIYNNWNIRGLFHLDDELNINKSLLSYLKEFRNFQDRVGVEFRCRGFLKSELVTKEQAEALYASGFRNVLIGFESGDPRILNNIRKMATVDDNTRAMDLCHEAGLKVKALLSLGHAAESPESIRATRDWVMKVHPDDFDMTIIQPYLSTPIYDEAVEVNGKPGIWVYTSKSGDKLYMEDISFSDSPLYYKGMPGDYKAFVYTDYISSEELVSMRDEVEKELRAKLNIPFYPIIQSLNFEHSMGQGFPPDILRSVSTS